jgi:hypothetical protein
MSKRLRDHTIRWGRWLRLGLLVMAGTAGAGEEMLVDQTFAAQGLFEWRTVFPETAERRWSWVFSAAETADGRIVMVWCSSAGAEVSGSNRILYSTSTDDGRTWCEPLLLVDSKADAMVINPVCYAHTDGRLFVFYNAYRGSANVYAATGNPGTPIVCRTSDDSGRTWGEPRIIQVNATSNVAGLLSPPLRLANGTILLPTYYGTVENSRFYTGTVMLSRDGGETWQQGGEFHVPNSSIGAAEPSIAQLANGDLLCLMRTTCGWQYESRSSDGGLTWTAPRQSVFPSPNACSILRRLASGRLIFVWDNFGTTAGTPRYPLSIAVSEDDGATWPRLKMLDTESGPNQLSNHGVFQTKAGTILVMLCRLQYPGERGPIEVVRLDETWLLSGLDLSVWEEKPNRTGGTRLEAGGLLLVSGAEGGSTDVVCRRALSADCDIEVHVERVGGGKGMAGVFLQDDQQKRVQFPVGKGPQSGTLRVRIRGGSPVAISTGGPDQGVGPAAIALGPAGQWGLFVRGYGTQARCRFAYARVSPNREPVTVAAASATAAAPVTGVRTIGSWQFNQKPPGEPSAGTPDEIPDRSGNGHHGRTAGNPLPTYAAGPDLPAAPGSSLRLAATGQRVTIPDDPAFDLLLEREQAYTIEAVVRSAGASSNCSALFSKRSPAGGIGYVLRTSPTGRLSFYIQGTGSNFVTPDAAGDTDILSDRAWHQVAVVVQPHADPRLTAVSFYVDRRLDGSVTLESRMYAADGENHWNNEDIENRDDVRIGDFIGRPEDRWQGDIAAVRFSWGCVTPENMLPVPVAPGSGSTGQ